MSSGRQLAVHSTLGAVSVGFFASSVVFGVLTWQVFTYFRRYPSDKPAYKVLVAALWLLEAVDQIFIGYSIYFYVVTNFLNPLAMMAGKVFWALVTQVAVGALVGFIVKACFAMRVWRFSNRDIYITGALLVIIFASFGFGIVYAVKAFQLERLLEVHKVKMFATLALSTGVAADILTAASLCFFLRRLRTGHKQSDSLVNTLTIYAMNTGALTSVASTCTVILYNIFPDTFYFIATYFVLSKLYALSFFCTLNTRTAHRGRGTDRSISDTGKSGKRSQTVFTVSHHRRTVNSWSERMGVEIGVAQDVTIRSDVVHPELDAESPSFPSSPLHTTDLPWER